MGGRYGRKDMKDEYDEDFGEEDVWGMMDKRENPSPTSSNFKPMMKMMMMREKSCPRMIPTSSSSSSSMINGACKQQFSAPLDIPDWSKIYGKSSKKKSKKAVFPSPSSPPPPPPSSSPWVDVVSHDDDDDDGDDGHGMVPPHEYIARKLARSQISPFSVCEGVGRTLKGRDLRKMRNAILTRTGFLE